MGERNSDCSKRFSLVVHLIIPITHSQDPRIQKYNLHKNKQTIGDTFIADHERVVLRLLESGWGVESIFCTPKYLDKHKATIEKYLPLSAPIYIAEEEVFLNTIGFSIHKGFLGIGYIPKDWEITNLFQNSNHQNLVDSNLYNIFKNTKTIVATNSIWDAENLGSIIRTMVALGVQYILTDEKTCSPYLRRCVRVSMGNIFYSQIRRSQCILKDLEQLQSLGYSIIGLSLPVEGKEKKFFSIQNFSYPDKIVLVVGNEAYGLDPEILGLCDHFITIPMAIGVDSLNVSHALGIALAYRFFPKEKS